MKNVRKSQVVALARSMLKDCGFLPDLTNKKVWEFKFHDNVLDVRPFLKVAIPAMATVNSLKGYEEREEQRVESKEMSLSSQFETPEQLKARKKLEEKVIETIIRDGDATIDNIYNELKERDGCNNLISSCVLCGAEFEGDKDFLREYSCALNNDYLLVDMLFSVFNCSITKGMDFDEMVKILYGSEKPLEGMKASIDLSAGVCMWVAYNWVLDVVSIKKKNRINSCMPPLFGKTEKASEESLAKVTKAKSLYIKYMEGKISFDELWKGRLKEYKTRETDWMYDALMSSFHCNGKTVEKVCRDLLNASVESKNYMCWKVYRECRFGDSMAVYMLHLMYGTTYKFEENAIYKRYEQLEEHEEKVKEFKRNIDVMKSNEDALLKKLEKRENKIALMKKEADSLKQEISKLDKHRRVNEGVIKLNKEKEELQNEVDRLKGVEERLNKELLEQKRKNSGLLKDVRLLDTYKETFGELGATVEEEEPVETGVSLSEMVESLKDYKIMLCSIYDNMVEELTRLGLNVVWYGEEDDGASSKQFDILVIYSKQCSHRMVEVMEKTIRKNGAMRIFFDGANNKRLIALLYEQLNK